MLWGVRGSGGGKGLCLVLAGKGPASCCLPWEGWETSSGVTVWFAPPAHRQAEANAPCHAASDAFISLLLKLL